jgi:hypothetical protein
MQSHANPIILAGNRSRIQAPPHGEFPRLRRTGIRPSFRMPEVSAGASVVAQVAPPKHQDAKVGNCEIDKPL